MPASGRLGLQVLLVVLIGWKGVGDAILDHDAMRFQSGDLVRIVGHELDVREPEAAQHRRGGGVYPLVGTEAELLVRVDGIESVILQLVGAQLVDQADAAAFLRQVEQHAPAGRLNFRDSAAQLIATVAAKATEQVAGKHSE